MQVMEASSSLQQHSGETDDDDYGDYGDDEINTACAYNSFDFMELAATVFEI